MSPLSLLVLASVAAAVAFFCAGLLLRRPRAAKEVETKGAADTAPLKGEIANLQAEPQRVSEALAESERRCQAEAEARKNEEAARQRAEHSREEAQAEALRLASKEKVLAERLRVAEDNNRATLDQVESNAAAWEAQWQTAKAQHQQHEQALQGELAELRARLDLQTKENQRLVAACEQHAVETLAARRAADDAKLALAQQQVKGQGDQERIREEQQLRLAREKEEAEAHARDLSASLDAVSAEWQRRLERAEAASQAKLADAEAAWRAKAEAAETAWRNQLADAEAAWRTKADAAEAAWQARAGANERALQTGQSALKSEAQRLAVQVSQLRGEVERQHEQNQRLELALRTADEALSAERGQAQSTGETLRSADERLREMDRLVRENAELRDEHERLSREAKATANNEGEAKDTKVELAAAQAKLAELGQALEENRRLRDEAAELRAHKQASDELERLAAVHKQLRLDAELMARRLQEMQHDQAELVPLRAQAAEAASLSQEVEYLRRREKELEAQLYASGFFASREMRAMSGELFVQTPVTDMETNLDSLLGQGGPRTAVLADSQGFLIAGAGESVAQEGLAAFAAVAGEMVSRARMLLPLAEIQSVRVTDANSMVLTCHLFNSDGEGLGVATLGPGEPPPEDTRRAIVGLAAIVGGGQQQDQSATSEQGGDPVDPTDDRGSGGG